MSPNPPYSIPATRGSHTDPIHTNHTHSNRQAIVSKYQEITKEFLKAQVKYISSKKCIDPFLEAVPDFCVSMTYNGKKMMLGHILNSLCIVRHQTRAGHNRLYENPFSETSVIIQNEEPVYRYHYRILMNGVSIGTYSGNQKSIWGAKRRAIKAGYPEGITLERTEK